MDLAEQQFPNVNQEGDTWSWRAVSIQSQSVQRLSREDPYKVQNALDLLRERCRLYVACTRARGQLVVTSSGTPNGLLAG